jgi:curved DNA-binding protein CbpA
VDPGAEEEVISAAYKRLSLKYHPDTSADGEANRRMQELNEAYAVLRDPEKRRQYDLMRGGWSRSWSGAGPEQQTNPRGTWREAESRRPPPPGKPPVSPRQALTNMLVTLVFPVVYVLATMVLFRVFPMRNIVTVPLILITAGVIAYYAALRVERAMKK